MSGVPKHGQVKLSIGPNPMKRHHAVKHLRTMTIYANDMADYGAHGTFSAQGGFSAGGASGGADYMTVQPTRQLSQKATETFLLDSPSPRDGLFGREHIMASKKAAAFPAPVTDNTKNGALSKHWRGESLQNCGRLGLPDD
jgi:hypothetical protein